VLGDGTVKEEGNYDELIEKRGAFYDLVKQQVL
jgi:ABC-type multidrug transport system fused ATPase/permease subunit